jgi:hypothetical protein
MWLMLYELRTFFYLAFVAKPVADAATHATSLRETLDLLVVRAVFFHAYVFTLVAPLRGPPLAELS